MVNIINETRLVRIETGRYEELPENSRLCPFCNEVENEMHAILNCRMYKDRRKTLFQKASDISHRFESMSDEDKFIFLFSNNDILCVFMLKPVL